MPPNATLLLTGATGFLGSELLARVLEGGDRPVVALVRAGDDRAAQERVDALVAGVVGEAGAPGRVTGLAADLTRDGLGLAPAVVDDLARHVTTVVHCAASVSFSLALEESRAINVDGTRRVLELARACARGTGSRFDRFAYVSTAFVSGSHRGVFGPDDLEKGQGFRNPYEQSKYECELLVRAAAAELPIQVFRPSIVVGDRRSGWTSSFNVLYQPLRAFSRGMYSILPGRLKAPVDVVPIDYVADALWALLARPLPASRTHLLVAGRQAATVDQLVDAASSYFGRPGPRIVDPTLFRCAIAPLLRRRGGSMRAVLEHSSVYFPYFNVRTWFDDQATDALLAQQGISVTPLRDYLPRLLDFAVATRWGKRVPSRIDALSAS
jgi:long-chain acyl-CoA synthetase